MGGVRKFWGLFKKRKRGEMMGKRIRDRESNTQHWAHCLPYFFLYKHQSQDFTETGIFFLFFSPPYHLWCYILCVYFLLYWMKMESSSFSFPPFWHLWCYILYVKLSIVVLDQYLSLIKFASILYPWTNEERMNRSNNIKNEVKPGAK